MESKMDRMTQAKRNEIGEYTAQKFAVWWHEEGSAMRPLPGEDAEEHVLRVSQIAWTNGAYCDDRRLRDTINDMMNCTDDDWIQISWRGPALCVTAIVLAVWWLLS
jgi:hypothetical protein